MAKIALLFIIAIAVLAIMGRIRLPKWRQQKLQDARKCPKCGSYKFDGIKCRCESDDAP